MFSCAHLSIDATHVYFAIVSIGNQRMRGDGIGRISIADQTFESLDLGIQGESAGPRRVYLAGDSMFAVDPFVVAAIKKTALDGKQDFAK